MTLRVSCSFQMALPVSWSFQMALPVSWSSGKAFASGAGGLRFKSRGIKSDTVFGTTRHRCEVSSKGAVLPGRNDAEMGPANSLHASAYYSKRNERFNLVDLKWLYMRAKYHPNGVISFSKSHENCRATAGLPLDLRL